jgi:peptidoglycan/xylan/chitin deacetylase (PgdA/CDA1 family)
MKTGENRLARRVFGGGRRWWSGVEAALDRAGAPVPVFFRDDDAGWGDARLLALLDRFAARGLPVDLAVIPAELDAGLARELCARERVGLHQHGFAHVNHERQGRKCEFGPSRDGAAQRRDIATGRERLAALLGDRAEPIFTPPWNRCTAQTGALVAELGFAMLSREARAAPLGVPGLRELPVSVDWCKDDRAERVAAAIDAGGPVGVMFHHDVMDAEDLRQASELLALLAERARPARMMELASAVV